MVKGCDEPIILKVYIHCEGCENEVLASLRGFEGVEVVEIDRKGNRVTVKGDGANPMDVADRVRSKTGKYVELISPVPEKEAEIFEEKAPEEAKVIKVVMKVYLHCEGCVKDVKQCIHGMEGVQTVDPDMKKNLITVKGTMDAQELVEFFGKKCSRHASIVKVVFVENCCCECKENENKKDDKRENICYDYNLEPCAPQFFSDENPNSCNIF